MQDESRCNYIYQLKVCCIVLQNVATQRNVVRLNSIYCIARSVSRASDAISFIDVSNVAISDHHSSVSLRTNMWRWRTIILICGDRMINSYFSTHIYKTYNSSCTAEEATFLFTVLNTLRCYLLIQGIRYHTVMTG